MDREQFRTWRAAQGYTQSQAADLLSVNRVTLAKWENGVNPIPQSVVDLIGEPTQSPADPIPEPAPEVVAFPDTVAVRNAMVAATIERLELKPWPEDRPSNVPERDFGKVPLGAGWQRLSYRVIHGSIPDPIPYFGPDWAGKDNIVSADGRVFRYNTGAEIHAFETVKPPRHGSGPRLIQKTYKAR